MPSENVCTSEKIQCPHDDGKKKHTIHVLHWRARQKGGLPPIVCVHGLTRRAEDFNTLAAALSETRDVYAFTMAGRGESYPTNGVPYTHQQCEDDCVFLMRHCGVEQADWVGTSLGGLVGIRIAASQEYRDINIRRLVLNDIGPFLSADALRRLAIRVTGYNGVPFKTREQAEAYCRFSWGDFGIDDPQCWTEFMKINLVSDENNFRLHYDPQIVEVMRHPETFSDMNYWNEYSRVACPTLVLHGEHSDMLSNEAAQEMTRHGPRPRIITFSGCGHAPALINPEQIGAVAGFLNS